MNRICILNSRALRSVALVLIMGMLTACNYLPKSINKAPDNWSQTVTQRQQLSSWKITARLGLQTEDNGGSLDVYWNQKDEIYKIRLIAAMGQGAFLIKGDAAGVLLKSSEGMAYAETADELLASSLGVNIPLSGLHDWLRGIPAEGRQVRKQSWDEQGQLHSLVQDGWNIEMSDYKKVGEHLLPHTFYLDRDDQPELEIRLLVRQWTLATSDIL